MGSLPFLLPYWMTVTVAIDCMGGDHGPDVTVRAALDFVRKHEDVRAILVGVEERIRPLLGGCWDLSRLVVRHASEVVAMASISVNLKKFLFTRPMKKWMKVS